MNVLIACEYSGVVREAFRRKGHNAYSCDILPSDDSSPFHVQADVRDVLSGKIEGLPDRWDLLIAHPPCDHLAVSGARWFKEKREDGRQQKGIDFFLLFTQIENIDKIAIENPIGIMSKIYKKPDQIVQPWMFGDPHEKRTCLWLKNLSLLEPTDIVEPEERHYTKSGRSIPKWYNIPPRVDRGKIRSKTFEGLAEAMASQWG